MLGQSFESLLVYFDAKRVLFVVLFGFELASIDAYAIVFDGVAE